MGYKKKCIFGRFSDCALVSIISVNYNGAADLPEFFESLLAQSYKNFEIIIVDNDSKDRSTEIISNYQHRFTNLTLINAPGNVGFAEGNNIGRQHATGELYALLNIDTRVDPDWLSCALKALNDEPAAAAVASKILFFKPFRDVVIKSDSELLELDISVLVNSLQYKKYFIRSGLHKQALLKVNAKKEMIISLPEQDKPYRLNFLVPETQKLRVSIWCEDVLLSDANLSKRECVLEVLPRNISTIPARYIINNAGSVFNIENMPCDRGFGQYDRGQFDDKERVPFFCGCSVLLRSSALLSRPIFIPEFFAYYEDSELSRWFGDMGYEIIYEPASIVYHRHSATSSEGSLLWRCLVERSHNFFANSNNYELLRLRLAEVADRYYKLISPELSRVLKSYDACLLTRLNSSTEGLVPHKKAIGIYNSYWNTYGGGESHALSLVAGLPKDSDIYLISETDFDVERLGAYYGMDLSRCKKIVTSFVSSEFTAQFDLFINSTFGSNLLSRARNSWYIVSFPHKLASQKFVKNYYFLYNSRYTMAWAQRYWGVNGRGELLFPVRTLSKDLNTDAAITLPHKKKIILSVGRFFPKAHSKNQKEIVMAFRAMRERFSRLNDWKLVLAGSLNKNDPDDLNYFEQVQDLIKDMPVEVMPNLPRSQLEDLYRSSAIYVHAAGYGQNPSKFPENFEHFGITPVEAMLNGCYPLAYQIGGPAELLNQLSIGKTFSNINDLANKMAEIALLPHGDLEFLQGEVIRSIKVFVDTESSKLLPDIVK